VSEITSSAHIVIVRPGSDRPEGSDPHGTLRALGGLGAGVCVDVCHSVASGLAASVDADLVVVDGGSPGEAEALLARARGAGPPVLAVAADAADADAVEWFRRGAADCVVAGVDAGQALASVALEQLRRARGERERRQVADRLAWLETLNAAIVSEIPAAIAVVDDAGRLVTANPAFTAAWGSAGRLPGRRLDEVLPTELLETGAIPAALERARAGHPAVPALARGVAPDGSPIFYDVRAQRLDDEGRALLLLADVTERETLAKRIADLRRYNENIIQNLNSALLVVDTRGVITFANTMASQILGAVGDDPRGRSVWDWFSNAQGQGALLARSLQDGERFRGAETILARADGSVVPVGISCAPLVDADGTRLGAVAIFQDLTEITLLQRQVLQTEKMASIGQLAAGVAHEINNPMGFIHANLFQMADYLADLRRLWSQVGDLRKSLDDVPVEGIRRAGEALEALARELDADFVLGDFEKAIRESQEGSERIRHIVRDLRDFSRADGEERVPADVNQCLDSTANIVWSMMKHSVVLKKRYADLPPVDGFPMQLKQVFMNLLVNAYQAIEERLGDSGERGEIELVTELRGGRVIVAVSDTGVGIAAEQLDRIFDPFFTTKEVGVGVGLGLSTSFNIVRKHGGNLRARNRRPHGAIFEVVLPVRPVAGDAERRG
jgi:PAS domain S-box-containing protein